MENAGPTSFDPFSPGAGVSTGCMTAGSEDGWVGAWVFSAAFVVSPGPAGFTVGA